MDAEVTDDDPNHIKDDDKDAPMVEVSRASIKACLHNIVQDEIVPAYRVFRIGRHLHEVDIDHRKGHPASREKSKWEKPPVQGTRRSPRDHPQPLPQEAKKKRLRRVIVEPTVITDTPIKTMDGNPLGLDKTVGLHDQDPPRTDYNNPAKVNDHEVESRMWVIAPMIKPKKEDITRYEKFFCGLPRETIEKTFEATTRLGRIITGDTPWLRNALKAPNPALNVKRRNEPVAMDTIYGPVGHPAIANGSTHAQFFIGRKSNYRSVYPCGKSDKNVHRYVEDEIRKLGAMDVLVSDRARSQISKKLHDVLRTFRIDDWQSEPHNKNQNFAERGWKDTKQLSNQVLDHSGAPRSAWLLALAYVCLLLNHVARKSLNWRTPIEWLLGYTPDITALLVFVFWEPVYYKEVEPSFANTPEKFGRFAGISAGVGHSMTFIIYVESGDLIHRSAVRSARHGGPYTNIHTERLAPSIAPKVIIEDLHGEKNYDLPETRAALEERLPEDLIRSRLRKASLRKHTAGNCGGRNCG